MSAGFTKGPWVVGYRAFDVMACDGRMKVCDVRGWGYLTGKGGGLALAAPEAEAIQYANAHLIAAAPALYEALLLATAYLSELPHEPALKIASALAQARGGLVDPLEQVKL